MKTYNVYFVIKIILVGITIFSNFSFNASAQTKPKVGTLVEILDNDANQCNIYKNDFISSSILIMRNNGIIYQQDHIIMAPFLYVNPNIIYLQAENRCLFKLSIEIKVYGTPINRFGFKTRTMEDIVICGKSYLGFANQKNASTNIIKEFEKMFKLCLSEIDY